MLLCVSILCFSISIWEGGLFGSPFFQDSKNSIIFDYAKKLQAGQVGL